MKNPITKQHMQALGLGAIAGMRSMSAPAILSHFLSGNSKVGLFKTPLRFMQKPIVATGLKFLAGSELLADKLPKTPNRITPPLLAARVLSGAVVGATVSGAQSKSKVVGALLGIAGAVASTFGFFYLRKKIGKESGLPNTVLGLAEDAIMASSGYMLMKS